jgi:hypothetical protein
MHKGSGLVALLGLALVGCSDIKEMPSTGRYLVVTRFGNALSVEKIGVTLISDDLRSFQDDTDLNKLFRDRTVDILGKESSWSYIQTDITMDAPVFDGDYGDYRSALIGDWHKTAARLDKLKQAARASHADILIYISETIIELPTPPIGNPFAKEEMISRGVHKHMTLGFDDRNGAFVAYSVSVYDVRTWKSRDYAGVYTTSFPQFEWPKLTFPAKPLAPEVVPQVRQALTKIEPPPDLPFVLCYLGLTNVTHDPLVHARAYTCAQHYGVPNNSISDVPIYWLTHPVDTNHWNLNQQH